jgi:hypothetical protein
VLRFVFSSLIHKEDRMTNNKVRLVVGLVLLLGLGAGNAYVWYDRINSDRQREAEFAPPEESVEADGVPGVGSETADVPAKSLQLPLGAGKEKRGRGALGTPPRIPYPTDDAYGGKEGREALERRLKLREADEKATPQGTEEREKKDSAPAEKVEKEKDAPRHDTKAKEAKPAGEKD